MAEQVRFVGVKFGDSSAFALLLHCISFDFVEFFFVLAFAVLSVRARCVSHCLFSGAAVQIVSFRSHSDKCDIRLAGSGIVNCSWLC